MEQQDFQLVGRPMRNVLVTGAAGFIGSALVHALLERGCEVCGLDNINSYYDTALKYARLQNLGILHSSIRESVTVQSAKYDKFTFVQMDLADRLGLMHLFDQSKFDAVVNLGGQAGVRYSIENPYAYVESNVLGFLNILENCRHHDVRHLVYASSSSIYGMGNKVPYAEDDVTDSPVSLYAATKKSDELMAYSYSKLYGFAATGLRFFTVYGPWGRPDMAPFIFMKSVIEGKPIHVFNHGNMSRDFTYIDDIIEGILLVLDNPKREDVRHRVYNIGHSEPVKLMDFIYVIEQVAGKKANMVMEGMQPGDVYCTYGDTSRLEHDFGYKPKVSVSEGIQRFHDWLVDYDKELKV